MLSGFGIKDVSDFGPRAMDEGERRKCQQHNDDSEADLPMLSLEIDEEAHKKQKCPYHRLSVVACVFVGVATVMLCITIGVVIKAAGKNAHHISRYLFWYSPARGILYEGYSLMWMYSYIIFMLPPYKGLKSSSNGDNLMHIQLLQINVPFNRVLCQERPSCIICINMDPLYNMYK